MKDVAVPEDLTNLTEEDLNGLATRIQQAAEGMRDAAASDDAALAALETLAAQYQAVVDEMAAREEQAMARQERVQSALSKIGGSAPTDEESETVEDDGEEMAAATTEETVATPVEAVETATEDGAELATIPHDTAGGRVPSAPEAELADENIEEAAVADDDSTSTEGVADPVAALSTARPSALAPARVDTGERRATAMFADSGIVNANDKGSVIDRRRLAELISAKHHQIARMSSNVSYEPIILATARTEFGADEVLGSGHEENLSVIKRMTDRGRALVASGGNCAPLTPSYDVFNIAEPMSPIEAALPTIGAPRGGVRYITPPSWTDTQAGVRWTTMAEDEAGYTNQDPAGTTAPKPCVHLECSEIIECEVDAISQCVTFGNLQYRTFPEQVEVFLDHLAVAFAQAKEIQYLDTIQAGSTAVTSTPPYGATRGSVYSLALAAHAYRKRNRMPATATLDLLAPDTLVPFLRTDMVNDFALGMNFITADAQQVANELLAALNINVTWYYDYATTYSATNALQQAQGAGGLNPWPTVYRTYLFSPGTWVRLDGGTLDVGIVRDSTLNSQNDLQMFSEEWAQVCKVGIESIRLDLTLCNDGTGPEGQSALDCGS